MDSSHAEFTAIPRPLNATERDPRIRGDRRVDKNHPGLHSLDELLRLFRVFSPNAGTQPLLRIIGQFNRLGGVLNMEQHRNRAEKFLAVDLGTSRHIDQNCRFIKTTMAVQRAAAREHFRPNRYGPSYLVIQILQPILAGKWTDVGGWVHRIASFQHFHAVAPWAETNG